MPCGPDSPTTPPQSVLSRSSTSTFFRPTCKHAQPGGKMPREHGEPERRERLLQPVIVALIVERQLALHRADGLEVHKKGARGQRGAQRDVRLLHHGDRSAARRERSSPSRRGRSSHRTPASASISSAPPGPRRHEETRVRRRCVVPWSARHPPAGAGARAGARSFPGPLFPAAPSIPAASGHTRRRARDTCRPSAQAHAVRTGGR